MLAIISQISKRIRQLNLSSLRWKILFTFLLIVVISFSVMASSMTGMVSNHLYTQRIRQDSLSVEKLAATLAPLYASASSDSLTDALLASGGEMGGRLLIVDRWGKTQFDSYGRLYGIRISLPEVVSILAGNVTNAYGVHTVRGVEELLPLMAEGDAQQLAYCTAALTDDAGAVCGALLYVSPVDELVASLSAVEQQMLTTFVLVALGAIALAQVFARIITKPVGALTGTIKKMSSQCNPQ